MPWSFLDDADLADTAKAKEIRHIMIFLSSAAAHPKTNYSAAFLCQKGQLPNWAVVPVMKLLALREKIQPWRGLELLLSRFCSVRFTAKDETVMMYARETKQLMSTGLAFEKPGSSEYYAVIKKLEEMGPSVSHLL